VTPRRAHRAGLLAAVLAMLCVPAAALAQAEQPPDDGRRTVARLPQNLLRSTLGVFSPVNLKPAVAGTAAAGLGAIFDDAVAGAIDDPDSTLGPTLEAGGAPLWSGPVVGVLFVAGRFSHRARFRAATYDWLDAYLVTAGYTALLKEVVGRARPNGQDDMSFPSGHASNAFALAAVAAHHFGWKVGVPAYCAAGAVALSRMQQNAHYLSDVTAGAALGYIVGRTVVRVNGQAPRPANLARIDVAPVLGRRTRALVVRVSF